MIEEFLQSMGNILLVDVAGTVKQRTKGNVMF